MLLSPEQKVDFKVFGFLVQRQLVRPQEMAAIGREFDDLLLEERGGAPFAGKERQTVQPFVERRRLLTEVVADDRIFVALEQLLGPGFIFVGSDGNFYVGDTPWHADRLQDPSGEDHLPWDLESIKVCFYFDPVGPQTGCLRVIPGSHHREFGERLEALWQRESETPYGVAGPQVPSTALESEPGDVVFFSQGMCHASFGGKAGRRMLALSFLPRPSTDEHVDFVKRAYSRMKWGLHPADSFVNSDSPRIRGMVSQLVEMGFETTKV